jgi:hypothetical protein
MALRLCLRVLSLIAVTLTLGYLWLTVAFDRGSSWTILLPLIALVAFWGFWILSWRPTQHVWIRGTLLACAILAAVPLAVEYFVVRPITAKEQRVQGNIRSHHAALASALETHRCPDGSILVVVPWITLRSGQRDRQLVELLLLPSDEATRRVFLARTTAHDGLHKDQELEQRWDQLELCFHLPNGLQDLLDRMEQEEFTREEDAGTD